MKSNALRAIATILSLGIKKLLLEMPCFLNFMSILRFRVVLRDPTRSNDLYMASACSWPLDRNE